MAVADSTSLETGTCLANYPQYSTIQAASDSSVLSFTPSEMLPGNPYGAIVVGSVLSFLRSSANLKDTAGRQVATRVSIVNPMANLALAGNVANAVKAANQKSARGAYVVLSGDQSAGSVTIQAGLAIASAIVQVIRSGKVVASDTAVSFNGGTLTVGSGSTYTLTAGDILNWSVGGV